MLTINLIADFLLSCNYFIYVVD